MQIPPRLAEEERARWVVEEDRGRRELRVYQQPVHMLAHLRGGREVVALSRYLEGRVRHPVDFPNALRPKILPRSLQTRRLQSIKGQVPVRETIMRWYRHTGMGLREEYRWCNCVKEPQTYEQFMQCDQYKEIDGQLLKKGEKGKREMERKLGKGGHRNGLWHDCEVTVVGTPGAYGSAGSHGTQAIEGYG